MTMRTKAVEEKVHGAKPGVECFANAGAYILQTLLLLPCSGIFVAFVVLHVECIHQKELDVVKCIGIISRNEFFEVTSIVRNKKIGVDIRHAEYVLE